MELKSGSREWFAHPSFEFLHRTPPLGWLAAAARHVAGDFYCGSTSDCASTCACGAPGALQLWTVTFVCNEPMYWAITDCAYHYISREEPLRPIDGSIGTWGCIYQPCQRPILSVLFTTKKTTIDELILSIEDTIRTRQCKECLSSMRIEADTS